MQENYLFVSSSLLTNIFFPLPSSVSYPPGPSGSLSQGFSACVREAGASPAAAGLQRLWIHDVKAH